MNSMQKCMQFREDLCIIYEVEWRIRTRINGVSCFSSEVFKFFFGASVGTVLGMLSFIISCIPAMKGGPPVSEKMKIDTAIVFLDWLRKVCPVFPESTYFLTT